MGLSWDAILPGLLGYRALPHRCELVRRVDGVEYVNDSKATSPNATMAALRGIDKPVILIAGGSDKGADFTALGGLIRTRIKACVLIGETAQDLQDAIEDTSICVNAGSLADALEKARTMARAGDCILLSPACASFDQFESYGHRGDIFRNLVMELS